MPFHSLNLGKVALDVMFGFNIGGSPFGFDPDGVPTYLCDLRITVQGFRNDSASN